MIPGFDPKKHIKLVVDETKVDDIIQNFPLLVNISNDSGLNHYDCQDIFNELTSDQGEVTTTAPIAHWTMDTISGSTLIDEKGNYDGTISNMTQTPDGIFKDYLAGGSLSSVIRNVAFPSIAFKSISMWVQRIDTSVVTNILKNNNNGSLLSIQSDANSDYIYFYHGSPYTSNLIIADTDWHHVVIVEGSSNNYHWVYCDNTKSSSEVNSAFAGVFTHIGKNNTTSQETCNIDNVQVFDYKLTDAEIQELYEAKLAKNKRMAVEYYGYQEHYITDFYTKLLIHSDTNDGSINFTDSSASSHSLLITGDTKHSAAQQKFGATSIYFDGDGDLLQATGTLSDWAFGTEDFTVDWWEYRTGTTTSGATCSTKYSGGYRGLMAGYDSSGDLAVYMSSDGVTWDIASGKSLGTRSLNEWVHLAVVRQGTTFYLFKNGVLTDTWTSSLALHDDGEAFTLGANQSGYYFQGYIDEFRISKGIARWTSNFTPPNQPYDNLLLQQPPSNQQCYVEIENWDAAGSSAQLWVKVPEIAAKVPTTLFLYYDNAAADNTNYIGDTASAAAQKVWDDNFIAVYHMAQNPSTTAPQILDSTIRANHGTTYGSMTNSDLVNGLVGKAIEFDGVDDYVNIDNVLSNLSITTFTAELLYNTTAAGSDYGDILLSVNASDDTNLLRIANNTSIRIHDLNGSSSYFSGVVTINNGIYHYSALTGDGSNVFHLVDGIPDGSGAQSVTFPAGGKFSIAQEYDTGATPSDFYAGIIDEVRISDIVRSDSWIKLTNESLRDNLLTFKYAFFVFNGYVHVEDVPAARWVYLYLRDQGLLIDSTISSDVDGYFEVSSPFEDYHFLNILPNLDDDYNILVYDKIHPTK